MDACQSHETRFKLGIPRLLPLRENSTEREGDLNKELNASTICWLYLDKVVVLQTWYNFQRPGLKMGVQSRMFWSETGPDLENQVADTPVRKAFRGVPAGGPAQARGNMWFSIFSRKWVNWKKYRIYSEVLKLVFSRETKNPVSDTEVTWFMEMPKKWGLRFEVYIQIKTTCYRSFNNSIYRKLGSRQTSSTITTPDKSRTQRSPEFLIRAFWNPELASALDNGMCAPCPKHSELQLGPALCERV